MPISAFFANSIIFSLLGIKLAIPSGSDSRMFNESNSMLVVKSSRCIFWVNNFICDPKLDIKLPMNMRPIIIVVERIMKTLIVLDLMRLSKLSTACKKIVVNRKENTNIPIIAAKNGRISTAINPIIISTNNL